MAKLIVAFMCVLCCIGCSTMTLSCYLTTSSESEAWLAKDIEANRQHHTQYGFANACYARVVQIASRLTHFD